MLLTQIQMAMHVEALARGLRSVTVIAIIIFASVAAAIVAVAAAIAVAYPRCGCKIQGFLKQIRCLCRPTETGTMADAVAMCATCATIFGPSSVSMMCAHGCGLFGLTSS